MSVTCQCCVLLSRGLCVGLIPRPEESYQVWCVCVIAQPQRRVGLGPLQLSSHWGVEVNIQFYMDHLCNIHNRQTSMHMAGFEHKIPASERPQTHALDRAAKGIGPVKSHGSHETNRTKRKVMFECTSLS